MRVYRHAKYIAALLASVLFFSGCGQLTKQDTSPDRNDGWAEEMYQKALENQTVVENAFGEPVSGFNAAVNESVYIDYSDISMGYITAGVDETEQNRIKLQITGGGTTYSYTLYGGESGTFPLTCGDGAYQAVMCRNIGDDRYAVILAVDLELTLEDEFSPYLRSNRFVDYENAPVTSSLSKMLEDENGDTLETVKNIFDFTVDFLTYDEELAAEAAPDYRPETDLVLEKRKGICFDYASLMTSMLRCRGIPCRLVVGYAGSVYHAWISVWTEEEGWVDNIIFFDGRSWQRMDPTFADSAEKGTALKNTIDNTDYIEKFIY